MSQTSAEMAAVTDTALVSEPLRPRVVIAPASSIPRKPAPPRLRLPGAVSPPPDERVRFPRHRGSHDDDVVPLVPGARHAPGDIPDLFDGSDGRSAVLLYNERHRCLTLPGSGVSREKGIPQISDRPP